ncbi:MAG: transglutaminase-like domain-containing protein [Massilibacteroides sp.]|nr:transglutaminase-like domain-containing protein [Massilibacteroides sp.]
MNAIYYAFIRKTCTSSDAYLLITLMIGYGTGCTPVEKHLFSSVERREQIKLDYMQKMTTSRQPDVVSQLKNLTTEEAEALQFLYAYMPIGDVTDYTPEFFLDNVRASLKVRQVSGNTVQDERLFNYFVLPIRINNENLDISRKVFYKELHPLLKGLSTEEQVLAVNHWCYEKVTYRPSSVRTSSPLATMRTAYGRCGEESTFTVAALRSVGIPARQVYTPRWAHTDDNHAWVEAWVNGAWHFLGACEPQPILDLAWFNAPAYRGLLMHTKVFGPYDGPEDIMRNTTCYTEINVTSNYAPTATTVVRVMNSQGIAVDSAQVAFKIYNYAEFYTVATKVSNEKGEVSLTAGKGDMLAWVTQKDKYGWTKVSFGKMDTVQVTLNHKIGDTEGFELDIVPPIKGSISAEVTPQQEATNTKRLLQEALIRQQYEATFYTHDKSLALAKALGTDSTETERYMIGSRGNYAEIEHFLRTVPISGRAKAMSLLRVISEKDWRDTPAEVLLNHFEHTKKNLSTMEIQYVLNPRVAHELLTPYRLTLQQYFIEQQIKTPSTLVNWIKNHIRVDNTLNPNHIPVSPLGVLSARVTDKESRDIFFIAAARSLGILSRLEAVAGKVQYYTAGKWWDVHFKDQLATQSQKGYVSISYEPTLTNINPKYYTHFTLAKLHKDGSLQTLSLASDDNLDMGVGDTWKAFFKKPLSLDIGTYVLVTGTRLASGAVLSRMKPFTIRKGQTTEVKLVMRESKDEVQVIGTFNSESTFKPINAKKEVSLLQVTGRGYYVVAILGAGEEPTNHALRDLAAVKEEIDQWGRPMVLLFPSEKNFALFDKGEFSNLPERVIIGIDTQQLIEQTLVKALKLNNGHQVPIFVIADTFNRVVFVSQGYSIGLGEQLLGVIHKL